MRNLACVILVFMTFAAPAPPAHADFAAGVAAFQGGDYNSAYREWRPLAEQGNAAAQHNLGTLYNYGLGLEKDLVEAARWYRRAARSGNADAQTKMGVFLAQGLGLARDYALAAGWFREAAEQHHGEAQYNLGVLYATGSGVEKDRVQALMWLALAEEAGVEQAARQRRLLIKEMPPGDVEEAALLAEIMRPAATGTGEGSSPPAAALGFTAPSETPAGSEAPTIAVQLASYVSAQAAADGWAQLRQVHGDLLADLNYGVATINLGEQGTFYRLMTGPFDTEAMAKFFCAELKARNVYCATSY